MQNEMNSSLTKPMSSWLQHQNLLNVKHSFHFFFFIINSVKTSLIWDRIRQKKIICITKLRLTNIPNNLQIKSSCHVEHARILHHTKSELQIGISMYSIV